MKINLLDKIQAQIADLQAGLQSTRPVWTKGADIVTLEQQLNKSISKIIATHLAQDPQLPPLYKLHLSEQRGIFQALKNYTTLLTTQILGNIQAGNNKENLNKKINTARKFAAAFLLAIYAFYDQKYLDKQRKKLARLLNKVNGKHKEETSKLSPQETPKEKPAPIPVLFPAKMEDYELADQLHVLGLTVAATHKEIEQAYQDVEAQYRKQNQLVPVAVQMARNTLMATPVDRLLALNTINSVEIQNFALNLKMASLLNPDYETKFTNIKAAFIEANIQLANPATSSAQSMPKLRRMELTMEKLENRYGKTPEKSINLAQDLLGLQPTQSPSRLGQTPILTPKGRPKV